MSDARQDMTERLLLDAGVAPGMRALDIGCGRGDVSLLLARLVGPQGHVVGVDRDAGALHIARERAAQLGTSNLTFVEGGFDHNHAPLPGFDVAVGRRVLMYQPDPVRAVQELAASVRPGGVVVFQEQDASMVPAFLAAFPLHRAIYDIIWRTVEREGANLRMGFELAPTLERAGLVVEQVRAESIVQTAKQRHPVSMIVKVMLERIVAQGVASAEALDVDTLDARLQQELEQTGATLVGDLAFGAWARKPM